MGASIWEPSVLSLLFFLISNARSLPPFSVLDGQHSSGCGGTSATNCTRTEGPHWIAVPSVLPDQFHAKPRTALEIESIKYGYTQLQEELT